MKAVFSKIGIMLILALTVSFLLGALSACTTTESTPTGQDGKTADTTHAADAASAETTGGNGHTHVFGEWTVVREATCTEAGQKERTCSCGEKETEAIAPAHTPVDMPAVPATCMTKGWSAGSRCALCGEVLRKQEKIPALGHEYVNDVCVRCGDVFRLPSEGLQFELNDDNESYSVTGIGTCTDTDMVIPSNYNDKPVTAIGERAFQSCERLTSVKILDSVKTINLCAFACCNNLKSVMILDSVTTIGEGAFYECANLTSATIPDSVTTIGESAFYGCYSLTNLTIPDSVNEIGYGAFSGCSSLTSVTIPDSVTTIGGYSFSWCRDLKSVTIPDSVNEIGYGAFSGCSSLTSVTIPDSVTTIGERAFDSCYNLESIVVSKKNTKYHSAGNCVIETESKKLIAGCKNSVIPNDGSVTTIGEAAFGGCKNLTSVTIPDSVNEIGNSAFYGCSSLTSVTIPDSVNEIGYGAFSGCSSLTSVTIPDSVKTIGDYAFFMCESLTSVTIPKSVIEIGERAFYWCNRLTTVYYTGTSKQWSQISIGSENDRLDLAEKVYNDHEHSEVVDLTDAAVGDTVVFGSFEQDNNPANGKEPIEWIVLDRDGDKVLVISKYVLNAMNFEVSTLYDADWSNSAVAMWLNGTFKNEAFTEAELNMIPITKVTVESSPSDKKTVNNRIFILSASEASAYFSSNGERKCEPTAYALAQSGFGAYDGYCWWWLRSLQNNLLVYCVGPSGLIDTEAYSMSVSKLGVRPAMWIDLSIEE